MESLPLLVLVAQGRRKKPVGPALSFFEICLALKCSQKHISIPAVCMLLFEIHLCQKSFTGYILFVQIKPVVCGKLTDVRPNRPHSDFSTVADKLSLLLSVVPVH